MKKKRRIFNRKGSYILEASVVLPVFIIGVILLISIIPAIRDFEKSVFFTCDVLRCESAKAAVIENPNSPASSAYIEAVVAENFNSTYRVTGTDYLFKSGDIEDLIEIDWKTSLSKENPLGSLSRIDFEGRLMTRAFTGRHNGECSMSREEFERDTDANRVFVFPKSGKKYHSANCPFLNPACKETVLNDRIKKKYGTCPICKSEGIEMGNTVFLFERAGEVYHRGSCPSVDKYYIEMDRDDAEKRGYMPCSKCMRRIRFD